MIFVQDESETPKALYAIRAEASGAVSPSMVQKALKARVGILRAFILPYEKSRSESFPRTVTYVIYVSLRL